MTATLPGQATGTGVQVTDRNNTTDAGQTNQAATTVPLPYPIPFNCTQTSDPTVGSTCGVQTTANTIVPGSAVQGKRAIWELGQFQILDQGPNGIPGDSDDNPFEVEGVFVP